MNTYLYGLRVAVCLVAVLGMSSSGGCPSWVTPVLPPPASPATGDVPGPLLPDGSGPAYYEVGYTLTFSETTLQALQRLSVSGLVDVRVGGTNVAKEVTLYLPMRVQADRRQELLSELTRELNANSSWKPARSDVRVPSRDCKETPVPGLDDVSKVEGICFRAAVIRIPRTTALDLEFSWTGFAQFESVRAKTLLLHAPSRGTARLIKTESAVTVDQGGADFDLIVQRLLGSDPAIPDGGDFVARMNLFRVFILDSIQGRIRVSTAQPADPAPYLRVDGKVAEALPFDRP